MAIALVQYASNRRYDDSAPLTVTLSSGVTAGNLVVLTVGSYGEGISLSASDSRGNTYISAGSPVLIGGTQAFAMFYVVAGGSGSLTVSISGAYELSATVAEFSGVASLPLDGYAGASGITSGTSYLASSGLLVPAGDTIAAGDLVVGLVDAMYSGSPDVGAGFALIDWAETTDNGPQMFTEYAVRSVSSTAAATATIHVDAAEWAVVAAAFSPSVTDVGVVCAWLTA